jgi:hypothetical protein
LPRLQSMKHTLLPPHEATVAPAAVSGGGGGGGTGSTQRRGRGKRDNVGRRHRKQRERGEFRMGKQNIQYDGGAKAQLQTFAEASSTPSSWRPCWCEHTPGHARLGRDVSGQTVMRRAAWGEESHGLDWRTRQRGNMDSRGREEGGQANARGQGQGGLRRGAGAQRRRGRVVAGAPAPGPPLRAVVLAGGALGRQEAGRGRSDDGRGPERQEGHAVRRPLVHGEDRGGQERPVALATPQPRGLGSVIVGVWAKSSIGFRRMQLARTGPMSKSSRAHRGGADAVIRGLGGAVECRGAHRALEGGVHGGQLRLRRAQVRPVPDLRERSGDRPPGTRGTGAECRRCRGGP